MPPIVEPVSSIDTRASGLTASQEQRVVDEYYDRGVQSPQALAITKTLGADSQAARKRQPVLAPHLQLFHQKFQHRA